MIQLDGNYLEGGGQILRTALALSTITGEEFKITQVRAGRKDAGLKPQHVTCVKALKQISGAKATGDTKGSSELLFIPGEVKGGTYDIDISTAGSVTLLLQSLLLPCMYASRRITLRITGGTNVMWSMPVEYLQQVMIPQMAKFCESIECRLLKRGYYPKGGGKIELSIKPSIIRKEFSFEEFLQTLRATQQRINLTELGELRHITGVSHASKDLADRKVAERQAEAAKFDVPVNIRTEYAQSLSTGSGIGLFARFAKNDEVDPANPIIIGASAIGERRKTAEDVGKEAANALQKELDAKAPVDEHLADNLIPFMALYPVSRILATRVSNHAKTNIYTTEKFLGKKFSIKNNIITSQA